MEVYRWVWSPRQAQAPLQIACFRVPAPKPNLAPAPRRAFPRAFPHLAGTANSHLSSWPSLPFAPANRPGKQRTPTTSPLTARRARPSSYFPIVGFPRLPYACALFSRPRLPRYQPRHCVASCCWHPPALGRSSLLRHGLETGNIKGTIDAPRLLPVCFPTRTCQELISEQDPRIQGAKTNHLETLSATDQPTPRHQLRHTLEAPFVNLAGKPTAPSSPSVRD